MNKKQMYLCLFSGKKKLASAYLSVLEVVAPQRADLVLTSDVPHGEVNVLVFDSFHVKAYVGKKKGVRTGGERIEMTTERQEERRSKKERKEGRTEGRQKKERKKERQKIEE